MAHDPDERIALPNTEPVTLETAEAAGVDLTLLHHNLRLTPTERVERFERALASVRALQVEAEKWWATRGSA